MGIYQRPINIHLIRKRWEWTFRRNCSDIDIYYIHWPSYDIPVKDTLSEFVRLKEEGLIRSIGVSNFSLQQLKEAVNYTQIVIIQPEYNLLHRIIVKEPFCQGFNKGIMSYSSIAKDALIGGR